MIAFLVRRILSALPALVGVTLVAFFVLNLLPSDPVQIWSGGSALSAEAAGRLRSELGVERGPAARYAAWALALLRGDLGHSLRDGRPVASVIGDALPWSLALNLCAVLAIYGVAVPLGLVGASSPGSTADRAAGWALLLLYAVPPFAAALLLQQWVAVGLGWLPLQGVSAEGGSPAGRAWDLLRHLVLPTLCLALSGWAVVARYSRAAFRSTIGREFLSVARAKGLSRLRAHLYLAAGTAVPFVTLLATIVPGLVGGSIIVEQVFSLPGVGRLYLASVEGRDYPVVMGLTLLSAVLVLAGHLVVDLLYLLVDPRIRAALLPDKADAF
ncbi:MAG TPA: ABC transporter permease [Candidatus Dormibacteraeota bacterium]|nr:ABC transporter permease [Candidatus Dormibacteraeota bacterium]